MTVSFVSEKALLTFEVNEKPAAKAVYDELHEAELLSISVKKYRKKRSLDANAYFWVLCGKLAEKTGQPMTEIYRHLIREISGNYEILPLKDEAVEEFCRNWGAGRLGWICDIVGKSKLAGYTNVCAYYGSSTYDTAQMSRLIDGIIQDCKEQGIETATPNEVALMLERWGDER